MQVLLIGVGGVGEAIAALAKPRPWLKQMVLADYDLTRAQEVQKKLGAPKKFPVAQIDAGDRAAIVQLARKHNADLIMNAVDPSFNEAIFDAAFDAGTHYMDMAMSLSTPHPKKPFEKTGVKLGDYQFARADAWHKKGILALLGMGVEPGLSDVFAKYAAQELFDTIDEIGVRDGANLVVRGYAFAPTFSIWTTIEECLNPPVIWEKGRGWYTTEPFSEPEVFDFPEGIGPRECVNVEHEEVLLAPRYLDCQRVTFKYGLGDEFISYLKMLHALGLDNKQKIRVKGVEVAPRDVVAACLPNPATLGNKMSGKTCAGTFVTGTKNGKRRAVYLYQVADNKTCLKKIGSQAVVAQTAFNPVIAMELLAEGIWRGTGVHGPEAFDPRPFLKRMRGYGFPYKIQERSVM